MQTAIGADENEIVLLDDQGEHHLARAPKETIARQLIAHVAKLYRAPKGRKS